MNKLPCLNEVGLCCHTDQSARSTIRGEPGLPTAARVLGSVPGAVRVGPDVVIEFVRKTEPHFYSLRRELA